MKKIILLILAIFCLVACSSKKEEQEIDDQSINYKIVCPSGAPSLALLDIIDEDDNIDIVDGSDVLQAEFVSGEADIIIAPINLGAKLASLTDNYQLAAVLTWGNLYLVSTVSIEETKLAPVAAFGQAAVPGKVLEFLSDELSGYSFEWYNAVNEASAALLAGQYNAAVLAEPILSMAQANSEKELETIIDIQELYKEKTGYDSYPQAALFVNKEINDDNDSLKSFLNKIDMTIDIYNKDNTALSKRIDEVDLSVMGFGNAELIKKAYPNMSLDYVEAYNCKEEIKTFLKLFDIELDEKIIY